MIQHIKLIIKGKVHGVGFRFSCMEQAYRCNIKGFVKNQTDGSVLIEAEGVDSDLNTFRAWCTHGPVWARVSEVKESSGEIKNFKAFEIEK